PFGRPVADVEPQPPHPLHLEDLTLKKTYHLENLNLKEGGSRREMGRSGSTSAPDRSSRDRSLVTAEAPKSIGSLLRVPEQTTAAERGERLTSWILEVTAAIPKISAGLARKWAGWILGGD